GRRVLRPERDVHLGELRRVPRRLPHEREDDRLLLLLRVRGRRDREQQHERGEGTEDALHGARLILEPPPELGAIIRTGPPSSERTLWVILADSRAGRSTPPRRRARRPRSGTARPPAGASDPRHGGRAWRRSGH